jgi:hypothetical protein
MKKGLLQSRGLGDILIALPIARYYYDLGDEIHWPMCEEFMPSVVRHVPWVKWHSVTTDAKGDFFLKTPLKILAENDVSEDETICLYQYVSSDPELTDPELFNILKFDQYKYWIAGVPFTNKWSLRDCVVRDYDAEAALKKRLRIKEDKPYAIAHLTGSNFKASIDVNWLDPAVKVIDVEGWLDNKESIFDWYGVLGGASAFVGIDSAFANLVDCMMLDIPELYWIRRSAWDLTPVMGLAWKIVPTSLPIVEPTRIDPAALALAKAQKGENIKSHVPYTVNEKMPTSFIDALTPSKPINIPLVKEDPAAHSKGILNTALDI